MVLTPIELQVITTIVTAGVTAIMGFVANLLRHKVGIAKIQKVQEFISTHKELAREAVLFAQQAYKGFSGQAKKDVAVEFLTNKLNTLKMPLPSNQVDALIQSALKAAKLEFGKQWNTLAQTPASVQEQPQQMYETGALPQTGAVTPGTTQK